MFYIVCRKNPTAADKASRLYVGINGSSATGFHHDSDDFLENSLRILPRLICFILDRSFNASLDVLHFLKSCMKNVSDS